MCAQAWLFFATLAAMFSFSCDAFGGVERALHPVGLTVDGELKPGWIPGDVEGLSLPGAQDSRMIRLRLQVDASGSGSGPILRWRGLELSGAYADGVWSLSMRSGGESEWAGTDFAIASESISGWLALDVVYQEESGGGRYAVFVEGAMIGSVAGSDAPRGLTVMKPDYAEVAVLEYAGMDVLPGFASRALYRVKHGEPEGAVAGLLLRSEEERRLERNYPDVRVDVRPGDLDFSEQAWFLTRTVNRSYYAYDDSFELADAPLLEDTLSLLGADYLPALESRSWEGAVVYRNWADFYVERIEGYVVPEVTGAYQFALSGDEEAVLFLGDASDPGAAERMCSVSRSTGQNRWSASAEQVSAVVELKAGIPCYFQIWHRERTGDDYVSLAWRRPDSGEEFALVSSDRISSFASGCPGTIPRNLGILDPALLVHPDSVPVLKAFAGEPTSVVNNELLANAVITESDFTGDADGWLVHADEGNGLGWVYSDESYFPWLSHAGDNRWYVYTESSANPQWFWRDDIGYWVSYNDPGSGYDLGHWTASVPQVWDFESGLTGWENNQADDSDWTRDSGGTPSGSTGPNHDQTLGTGSGYYVYVETSSGGAIDPGDTSILDGPVIKVVAGGTTVGLYYHMYGANMGTLYLEASDDGSNWDTLWSVSGQQHGSYSAAYSYAEVTLSAANYFNGIARLRLRSVAAGGVWGDMAVDDVVAYHVGADTDGDTMLDGWEFKHDLDFLTEDGSGNADSDGLLNVEEFWLASDPGNTTSEVSGGSAPELLVF